jgi:CMP-N-acetylneuraminic acid synthetase
VFVSTDDEEIADVARRFGATVIERPNELALDKTPMNQVVEHAMSWSEASRGRVDRVFLLQATSPLRTAGDIRLAASMLDHDDCDSVMAVYEAPYPPEWTLRPTPDRFLTPPFGLETYVARRQDLLPAYLDGPLYAIEAGAFLQYRSFLTQRTRFFVVPPARAIDIDTEFDLRWAELLIEDGIDLVPSEEPGAPNVLLAEGDGPDDPNHEQ